MEQNYASLYSFILLAEKLKTELRHSWTSRKGRQESVAEHSWLMSLIAMAVFDSINVKVDQLKVMKMIALHDLAETIVGDIPAFEKSERRTNKFAAEEKAMQKIVENLPSKTAKEFLELWYEMEANDTAEAKLAQCMDKIEVLIQHLISDIDTWDEGDYGLGPYNKDEYFGFNPFVRGFKDYVNEEFWKKMEQNDKLGNIKPEHKARRAKKLPNYSAMMRSL